MNDRRPWKLLVPVAVNLLLGVPAVVPLFLIWYVAVNGPLADLGWTQRDPNEDDGMLLWLVIVVPILTLFASVWALVNDSMRRRTPVPAAWYWPACILACLVPYGCLVLRDL